LVHDPIKATSILVPLMFSLYEVLFLCSHGGVVIFGEGVCEAVEVCLAPFWGQVDV